MYECCNTQFETYEEFKKHIKSKRTHDSTKSTVVDLQLPKIYVEKVLSNVEFFARLMNLSKIRDDNLFIMPLRTNRNVIGSTLKRSIAVKLEGPKLENGMRTYLIYAGNMVYKISFKVDGIGENFSRVSIIVTMEAILPKLAQMVPSLLLKSMSAIPTPYLIVDELEKDLKMVYGFAELKSNRESY